MGTTAIDIMQSAQITTLQNDVAELTTKLNAVVADIATLKDKIGTTYPATGVYGGANDTLYQRLYQLDTDIADVTSQLDAHISNHPGTGNQGNAGRASGGMSNLNSFTTSSTNASTTGVYTPQSQQVITVTDASATRAREVARDAVKRIRGI